ncbi:MULTISPECIES: DnaA regulatory inactivator Hda [Gammaproteobacteria]|uniref:DnaA regulatory inactivator Hda n=1 Tax=Gammaproteobacteria TaxID=1236 RepID=UPI000DD01F06|nr:MULTISPECIES: DnaA regulatory inactivator Hda [Gammaproteobacteria]RTE87033.1 DnaA regulatory inactivator Hda [Aliidiomarina sp. B3213]TCZ93177.1 DnaA regulatory inactivator Hda [Lysobacter sp. N42]
MAAMKRHRQLTLPVELPETAQFETFVTGENEQLVNYLREFEFSNQSFQQLALVGTPGSGKSHLLFAFVDRMQQSGVQAMYIDCKEIQAQFPPSILDGLHQYPILILDGIDAVVGDEEWCVALFTLINRFTDQQSGLLVWAAENDPSAQGIVVPDLTSRLELAIRFRLQKLSDEKKVTALKLHAKARGMKLSREVAEYLLQRLSRDMRTLMKVLKALDQLSIREQRPITLPFVRNALKEVTL